MLYAYFFCFISLFYLMNYVACNNSSFLALASVRFGLNNKNDYTSNRNYYLPQLRSISTFRNTTFIFLTDHIDTSIKYPSNVLQIYVTWEETLIRIENYTHANLASLKLSTNYIKVADFRPILPIIYAEYFTEYKWFGWMDNDVWFSSELEKYIIDSHDKGFSQVSLLFDDHRLSWGPISMFSLEFYNKYVKAELLKDRNRNVMINVFNRRDVENFDEWGESRGIFEESFSRILLDIYNENKNLKYLKANEPSSADGLAWDGVWDGVCLRHNHWENACGSCLLIIKNGHSYLYESVLQSNIEKGNPYEGWFICNFQFSKSHGLRKEVEQAYFELYDINNYGISAANILEADMIETSWHGGWSLTSFNNSNNIITTNYTITVIVVGSITRLDYKKVLFQHIRNHSAVTVEYYDESNLPTCATCNETDVSHSDFNWLCSQKKQLLAIQKSLSIKDYLPDFIFVVEDDTFINMKNLVNFINLQKPEEALYKGQELVEHNMKTVGNGGGVVISKNVTRVLKHRISECVHNLQGGDWCHYRANLVLSYCLQKLCNIEPTHSKLMRQFLKRPEDCQHEYITCHGFFNSSTLDLIYNVYN